MHTKPSYNVVFITLMVKVSLVLWWPINTNTFIVCVQVSGVSSSVLETVFKQWDSQGTLLCNSHLNSAHPVYIVQTTGGGAHNHTFTRAQPHKMTLSSCFWFLRHSLSLSLSLSCLSFSPSVSHLTEAGFHGLLSGIPKEIQQLFSVTKQQDTPSYAGLSQQNNYLSDIIIKTQKYPEYMMSLTCKNN